MATVEKVIAGWTSSRRHRRYWHLLRLGWALPTAVVLLLISETAGSYWRFVAGMVVIYAITAMGLTILTGLSGQISLAHVAFFGLGGYTEALLMGIAHLPLPVALTIAVAVGTLAAVLAGMALSRLSNLTFAIATLGITIIFQRIVNQWTSVTGGHLGLNIQVNDLFGFVLTNFGLYLMILFLFVLAATGATLVRTGALGRRLLAVKGSTVAAAGVGISASRTNLLAFSLAGGYAALGGSLYGVWVGYLSPDQFSVNVSVLFLAIVVLGALKSVPGAFFAAAVLVGIPQIYQAANRWTLVAYGLLLVFSTLAVGGDLRPRVWRRLHPSTADLVGSTDEPSEPVERTHRLQRAVLPPWLDTRETPTTLTVRDVAIAFGGTRALQDVSLTVAAGEVVAIIGPNGAGKSTLLNIITGLYAADAGFIELDGRSLLGTRTHEFVKRGIARTYQSAQKWSELTVAEHVAVAHPACASPRVFGEMCRTRAVRRRDHLVARECAELLGMLGLADRIADPVGDLPHGELQLLQLARALICRPRVLLLDEITAGLTAEESADLGGIIRRLAHDYGIAILVIAHDMPLVMESADRVVVLDSGRSIAEGTPQDIRANPRVVSAYLGSPKALRHDP